MTTASTVHLLTINTGSSSLKAAGYAIGASERCDFTAQVDRIGAGGGPRGSMGSIRITGADGGTLLNHAGVFPDHVAALDALLGWIRERSGGDAPFDAVGHRIVHGGPDYRAPAVISDAMLAALHTLVPIDPDHLPQAIATINALRRAYPAMPQVGCFDTAFHRQMPPVARRYALPQDYADAGVMRYGFHGLSYEYIIGALRAIDPMAADGRVVIAHLGNGASMAAVRGGVSVDTTMGFTPTGGLVMGTRAGDLDPGVLVYAVRERGLDAAALSDLVNTQGGMKAVSGTSGDMRDLLAREGTDPRAAVAIDLFCYTAKKALGALVAVLGGLDTLIFTGGIGEHAAPVRERICAGLTAFGIALDPTRNGAHAPVISADDSPTMVRVMPTDEDLMIARHTYRLITETGGTYGR